MGVVERTGTAESSPFRRVIGWLLLAFAILKLPFIILFPLTGDEALIWQWGQHLDWCYIDHVPMGAWLVRLSTELLGNSPFAARLPGLLCGLATIWAFATLAKEVYGSDRIGIWTGVVFAALPMVHATSLLVIVDGPLILFVALAALAVVRATRKESTVSWLWVGFWLGLAMLSKLAGILAAVGIMMAMAFHPQLRPWFRRPGPYLAAALALLLFSPVVSWNARHEWIAFSFAVTTRHGGHRDPLNILYYFTDQMTPISHFLWLIAIVGIVAAAKQGLSRLEPGRTLLVWLAAVPLVVYGIAAWNSRGGGHWPSPGLMFALLLGIPLFIGSTSKGRRVFFHVAWGFSLAFVLFFHGAVAMVDRIAEAQIKFRGEESSSELKAVFGWKEIGERVDAVRSDMAKEGPVFLITPNHVFAAQFTFYAPNHLMAYRFGEPSVSGRDYERWQRYADWKGHNAIYFHDGAIKGGRLEKLQLAFDRVELEPPLPIQLRGKTVRIWYLARCYGFKSYPWPGYLENPIRP